MSDQSTEVSPELQKELLHLYNCGVVDGQAWVMSQYNKCLQILLDVAVGQATAPELIGGIKAAMEICGKVESQTTQYHKDLGIAPRDFLTGKRGE